MNLSFRSFLLAGLGVSAVTLADAQAGTCDTLAAQIGTASTGAESATFTDTSGNVTDLTRALDQAFAMTHEQRVQLSAEAREYAMRFDRAEVFGSLVRRLSLGAPTPEAVMA